MADGLSATSRKEDTERPLEAQELHGSHLYVRCTWCAPGDSECSKCDGIGVLVPLSSSARSLLL